jgi:hypothetical protein
MNNKNRQIKRDRKNPKCENYNSKDLIELVQTLFRIYTFYRIRGYIIT